VEPSEDGERRFRELEQNASEQVHGSRRTRGIFMRSLYKTCTKALAIAVMLGVYVFSSFAVSAVSTTSASAQGRGGRGGGGARGRGGRGGGGARGRGRRGGGARGRGRRGGGARGRGRGRRTGAVVGGVGAAIIGGIIASEVARGQRAEWAERCDRWRRMCRRGNDWACDQYDAKCD